MHYAVRSSTLLLALLWLPVGAAAAHKTRHPVAAHHKTPKLIPKGRLARVIPVRVTLFYSLKDKKTGALTHLAAVSRTLKVKVIKPTKRK